MTSDPGTTFDFWFSKNRTSLINLWCQWVGDILANMNQREYYSHVDKCSVFPSGQQRGHAKAGSCEFHLVALICHISLNFFVSLFIFQNHRIMKWFGLKGTLKTIQFQPSLTWAGTPATRWGCSKHHPTQYFQEWGSQSFSGQNHEVHLTIVALKY